MNIDYLKSLGFTQPNIVEYKDENFQVFCKENFHTLYINNARSMFWNSLDNKAVFEFYSHYDLAKGHCICTGMGFLLREKWLLNKKEVTKLTVIENNTDVIEYHRKFNKDVFDQIEVINMDVYDYQGKCDTLLMDNFECNGGWEFTYFEPRFLSSLSHITSNIKSEVSWAWPIEEVLMNHYRDYIGLSLIEIYENIKTYFNLQTFPNLTESQLAHYCYHFSLGNFSLCHSSKL